MNRNHFIALSLSSVLLQNRLKAKSPPAKAPEEKIPSVFFSMIDHWVSANKCLGSMDKDYGTKEVRQCIFDFCKSYITILRTLLEHKEGSAALPANLSDRARNDLMARLLAGLNTLSLDINGLIDHGLEWRAELESFTGVIIKHLSNNEEKSAASPDGTKSITPPASDSKTK